MSSPRPPLTARQLEVLRWVADGCPEHVWPDQSHKVSARALEARHLLAVRRRDGRWHAQLTPSGAHYLKHGADPTPPAPPSAAKPSPPNPGRSVGIEIPVVELLGRLRAGPVRVRSPSPQLRAAYRRAINAAIIGGHLPTGLALRHTGRDRGDLVISLVTAQPVMPKPAPIPIPPTHDPTQPAIEHLLAATADWGVSASAQARALRLVQALADEAARRGHHLGEPPDDISTFRIDIGEDSFAFLLTEEHDAGDQIPRDQLAAVKYPWQRVSPQPAMIPSGRLVLERRHRWRHPRWADRRRWRLEDKFPAVLELIEQHAAQARHQREDAAAERARRHQLWEQAVLRAHERYVYDVNAERLLTQARGFSQAAEILAYCQRLTDRAANEPDPATRRAIQNWAGWARAHAETLDPLNQVEGLRHVDPTEARPEDLDRYMPDGMTAAYPPD